MRLVADEVDFLDEGAIGITRFEPELLELLRQICDCLLLAGGTRGSPFHRIRREVLDVLHERRRIDRLRGGGDGGACRGGVGKGRGRRGTRRRARAVVASARGDQKDECSYGMSTKGWHDDSRERNGIVRISGQIFGV